MLYTQPWSTGSDRRYATDIQKYMVNNINLNKLPTRKITATSDVEINAR